LASIFRFEEQAKQETSFKGGDEQVFKNELTSLNYGCMLPILKGKEAALLVLNILLILTCKE
jgi:hypothetical protein